MPRLTLNVNAMPAERLNDKLTDPKTVPTHIDIEGYGRITYKGAVKGFFDRVYKPVVADVPERILYVAPVRPEDRAPARAPAPAYSTASLLFFTIGLVSGGCMLGIAIFTSSPLDVALGAAALFMAYLEGKGIFGTREPPTELPDVYAEA